MSAKALAGVIVVAVFFIVLVVSRFAGSTSASPSAPANVSVSASTTNPTTSSQAKSAQSQPMTKSQLKQIVDKANQAYNKVYYAYEGTPSSADQSQFLQLEGQEARALTQMGMSLPDTSGISSMAQRALIIDTNSVIASAQTCMADMAGVLDGNVTKAQLKSDIQFYQQQYTKAVKALA